MKYIQKAAYVFSVILMMSTFAHTTESDLSDEDSTTTSSSVTPTTSDVVSEISSTSKATHDAPNRFTQEEVKLAMQGSMAVMQARSSLIINSAVLLGQVLYNNPVPGLAETIKFVSWHSSATNMIWILDKVQNRGSHLPRSEIDALRDQISTSQNLAVPLALLLYMAPQYLNNQSFDIFLGLLTVGYYYYQINLLIQFEDVLAKGFGFSEGREMFFSKP